MQISLVEDWQSSLKQTNTDMVMGDPNFLPNPCAILCPFDGPRCTHGFFRMNGSCKPSQLFSHWQHMHANNPAAKQLEARWRQAIKMKGISLEQLDQCAPCTLTGDTEEGYEPLRTPPATPDGIEPSIVFPHSFEVGSAELREWLAGSGI